MKLIWLFLLILLLFAVINHHQFLKIQSQEERMGRKIKRDLEKKFKHYKK